MILAVASIIIAAVVQSVSFSRYSFDGRIELIDKYTDINSKAKAKQGLAVSSTQGQAKATAGPGQ